MSRKGDPKPTQFRNLQPRLRSNNLAHAFQAADFHQDFDCAASLWSALCFVLFQAALPATKPAHLLRVDHDQIRLLPFPALFAPRRPRKSAINNSRSTRQGAVRLGKHYCQVNSYAALRKIGMYNLPIYPSTYAFLDGLIHKHAPRFRLLEFT
jgi:hypothetical protein